MELKICGTAIETTTTGVYTVLWHSVSADGHVTANKEHALTLRMDSGYPKFHVPNSILQCRYLFHEFFFTVTE